MAFNDEKVQRISQDTKHHINSIQRNIQSMKLQFVSGIENARSRKKTFSGVLIMKHKLILFLLFRPKQKTLLKRAFGDVDIN